jgi:hypothetical protein
MIARKWAGTGELNLFQVRRQRWLLSSGSEILRQFGRVKKGREQTGDNIPYVASRPKAPRIWIYFVCRW